MAVPTQATEVWSLADAKRELRDPPDAADAMIEGYIAAAVDYIERYASISILEDTKVWFCQPVTKDRPFLWHFRHAFDLVSIKYWDENKYRQDPDGAVALNSIGRVVWGDRDDDWRHCVYPPEAGWPVDDALDCTFRVEFKVGLDVNAEAPGLRQAIMLCIRQLWDGQAEISPNAAMHLLASPWMYMTPRDRYPSS